MKLARDAAEFLRAPLGRAIAGPTYLIWCRAPDLAGSIQWGAPDERDVAAMMDALEFIRHPQLAAQCAVLMDCRAIERVDADVLIGFTRLARERLPRWSPRIRRQAVVVPDGVAGFLLAGALPLLGPAHPFHFAAELEEAVAFLEHPDARAAYDEAVELATAARGSSVVLGRLRAELARDLGGATVDAAAAALGLTARTLQRALREHGTSFTDELRRARVAAADELLRLGDLAGIPAAIVGGILWLIVRHAKAGRISVHRQGVRMRRGNELVQLRFDEVEAIKVRAWQVMATHVGGLGGVAALAQVGVNAAARATSRRSSDLPYDATQVTVKIIGAGRTIVLRKWDARWADAYAEIRAQVEPRLLATARAQLANGAASFGPVRVAPDALSVGAKAVSFGDLERVEVSQMLVLFKKRGKRMPAARVHLSKVENLHVMLDLVRERAPAVTTA